MGPIDEGKKQPTIESPDGNLQIIHFKVVTGLFGEMAVEGAVKNIGLKPDISAVVKVEYFDSCGEYIDCSTDTVRHLSPGRVGAFEVVYSGQIRYRIKSLKLSVTSAE